MISNAARQLAPTSYIDSVLLLSPLVLGSAPAPEPPVVTAPDDITINFAYGGPGLSQANQELIDWLDSATATSGVITTDVADLGNPIPAGGPYVVTFTSNDSGTGLSGQDTANLTVEELPAETVAVNTHIKVSTLSGGARKRDNSR